MPDPESPPPRPPEPPDGADPDPAPPAAEFVEAMKRLDDFLPIPDVGQRLHATIREIGEETTLADYGGRSEATIETRHLKSPDGQLLVKVGDRIEAYVVASDESVVLAPALVPPAVEALKALREAHRAAMPVSGKVTGVNAGGLEVDLTGNRAFCPTSQIEVSYCSEPSAYVGRTLEFRILEFGDMGRRIVLSRRTLLMQRREETASRVRESLREGEEREGTVVRMEAFGAFVDLGGLDGMVHVSEVAHDRVSHPSEALAVGDKVRVKVLQVGKDEKGRDRISLSIKAAQQDPWIRVEQEIQEGQRRSGRVARIAEFGAFVRLLPGIEGLLHASEVGEGPGALRETLKDGQEVSVRVVKVDAQKRRISLSMRDEAAEGRGGPRPGARVGERYEGVVRAHKPYGIFIDIPALGERASGLLPLADAGGTRREDLPRRFPPGERLQVVVQQIDEKGRIRLAIPSTRAAGPPPAPRGTATAMADALRKALEARKEAGG